MWPGRRGETDELIGSATCVNRGRRDTLGALAFSLGYLPAGSAWGACSVHSIGVLWTTDGVRTNCAEFDQRESVLARSATSVATEGRGLDAELSELANASDPKRADG